ncbi:MAG: hypothetical protein KKH34_09450 [Candidatus Omnitrophica bacterium]|nr:hypothetical protein [Candidatus Omnitrophota bacterium]MCG2703270.1 hypothetical protein [Candidatus Omnitrophota bacterium]
MEGKPKNNFLNKIIGGIIIFCIILILITVFIARAYLNTYRLFTQRHLVAVVECQKTPKARHPVLCVELYPETEAARKKTLFFNADEWVIEGHMVLWKPVFGIFGAQRYYRLERISGRYRDIEKEKKEERLVYSLSEQPDRFWFFIYRYQRFIPFVEAAYGNSAFVPFEPGKKFHVYVTYYGFMIKEVSEPKKRNWWSVG